MILKAKNRTHQTQQINLVGGDCITVSPRGEVEIDLDKIYKEEHERIKAFFKFDKVRISSKLERNVMVKRLNYGGN